MLFVTARKSSSHSTAAMDTKRYSARLLVLLSLIALGRCEASGNSTQASSPSLSTQPRDIKHSGHSELYSSDMEEFKHVMLEYVEDVLGRKKINLLPGVSIERKTMSDKIEAKSLDSNFMGSIKRFVDTHSVSVDMARAAQATGRLFFFKGEYP
jgi:hypothetical protein